MLRPSKTWSTTILRWAGSKRALLPTLMNLVPLSYQRYIEPFAGSASLFFALRPAASIVSDINPHLMATYQVLRNHPLKLHRLIQSYPVTSRFYYDIRQANESTLSPLERAARFIYLNRHCFNGVYRTNKNGLFNVPRGSKTGQLPSESIFRKAALTLRNASLRTLDFQACLEDAKENDFVYLDPPYAIQGHRDRGEYGCGSFQARDVLRLIQTLTSLDRKGATFLLSFADCPEIEILKLRWSWMRIVVQRHVAGFSSSRACAPEILLSNYTL